MDKKIIAIMVTLVVVAALVVAVVMVAAGGIRRPGGFTDLFDKLEYNGTDTYDFDLSLPDSWDVGDKKTVSDIIVDMFFEKRTIGQTSVYITTMYFVYLGNKWNNPQEGTSFNVPVDSGNGWLHVDHGRFSITVSSATNLSAEYDVGDVITLETSLVQNSNTMLAFGDWVVANTL
ncbi:MAG: hypothetical protein ACUVT7_04100 [Thermoplasmata archaeon]